MTTRRRPPAKGHEPLDAADDQVQADLDRAETVESAGMQNAWAVAGPAALLMVPVAWALTRLRRLLPHH